MQHLTVWVNKSIGRGLAMSLISERAYCAFDNATTHSTRALLFTTLLARDEMATWEENQRDIPTSAIHTLGDAT